MLPPRAEAIYGAITARVDTRVAMDVVTFMAPLWRLAGNPAYDQSIDFIAARLPKQGLAWRVESYENSGRGWEQQRGTVTLEGSPRDGGVVAGAGSRGAVHQLVLHAARRGRLPLVDVGAGAAADFAGKDVKGAVVLGDAARRPAVDARRARARRRRGDLDRCRAVHAPADHSRRAAVGQHPVRRNASLVCLQGDAARGETVAGRARGRAGQG